MTDLTPFLPTPNTDAQEAPVAFFPEITSLGYPAFQIIHFKRWISNISGRATVGANGIINADHFLTQGHRTYTTRDDPPGEFRTSYAAGTLISAAFGLKRWPNIPSYQQVTGIVVPDDPTRIHYFGNSAGQRSRITMRGVYPLSPQDVVLISTLRWLKDNHRVDKIDTIWNTIRSG